MNRKIVRIEHADGWGMFRGGKNQEESRYSLGETDETLEMCELHNSLPTPKIDRGFNLENLGHFEFLEFMEGRFCAYKTLDSFYQWIVKDELEWLLTNYDFKVLLIEVTELLEGDYQVLYKKEHIVNVEDISSLFLD
jgi:hypothetical protein